ncbi:MAG: DUF2796 domain-containing protein [Azoarcus sp.]|nr:DUF2796 domain-containing protein [Azoarcus sp.]
MKKRIFALFFSVSSLWTSPAWAHDPHEHGVARLNVALEDGRLAIELDSPLANLLSFEHAPRTDSQRDEVRAMVAKLRKADALFVLPKAASCRLESVALESGNLPGNLLVPAALATGGQSGGAQANDEKDGAAEHGELEASFVFRCDKPETLTQIDIRLFGAFPALREIEAQIIVPGRQSAAELTPKASLLKW